MTIPTVISLRYGCHICEKTLSQASKLKQHLLKLHNMELQSRSEGRTRGNTQQFKYISQEHEGNYTSVHVHYACVSCLSHFPELNQLKSHINDTHDGLTAVSDTLNATQVLSQSGSNDDDESVLKSTYFSPEPLSDDKRYMVDDFDVSQAFHQFQISINTATSNLFMESHVHHILAMSYVLLVKPHRMHPNLVNIFGAENINKLQDYVRHEFGFGQYGKEFDVELMLELKNIVRRVRFQQMTRLAAQADLLQKANAASPLISRIISSVARLITMLPKEEITSVIKEQELCTRYLDPALLPLFDDPDNNIFFRWTGTMNDDSKAVPKGSISSERPDVMVSCVEGVQFGKTIGFAEMKPADDSDNNYVIAKDLIRLGGFSKNAIDQGNVGACLSIQCVNHTATFYLTKLMADGLYFMMELAAITLPSSITNLQQYLVQLDDVLNVLFIFEKYCKPKQYEEFQVFDGKKRPSASTSEINRVLSPFRDRKRQCTTRHIYK